jgi:hypothetical protein
VLGSLCVIDTKPRTFNAKDRKLLQVIADELMANIEAQGQSLPELASCTSDGPMSVCPSTSAA